MVKVTPTLRECWPLRIIDRVLSRLGKVRVIGQRALKCSIVQWRDGERHA